MYLSFYYIKKLYLTFYFIETYLLNDDEHYNFMNAEIYEKHPCIRSCEDNKKPMICQYKFLVNKIVKNFMNFIALLILYYSWNTMRR